jgi:AraC-like DNA-binding protein
MYLGEIKPCAALAPYVRIYRIIDFDFGDNIALPIKAYTPRPEQCLQFFQTPTKITYPGTNKTIIPKNALIVGQHTKINDRTVYQKFLSLQVVFQPGALKKLLKIPAIEFTNRVFEAEDVMGKEIEYVNEQLFYAKSRHEMIVIIENYLLGKANKFKNEHRNIDAIAQQMLQIQQTKSLDWFVSKAFLCHRQFDRKFIESAGISPKEYLRVIRFDHAYRLKNQRPELSWFNIAIICGYYDYQHLAKDYKAFTGYSPVAFFAMDSPERLLGTEEVY